MSQKDLTHARAKFVFSENLQRAMESRGLTQADVAVRTGFHQSYLSILVNGKKEPLIGQLFVIANALDMSAAELLAE